MTAKTQTQTQKPYGVEFFSMKDGQYIEAPVMTKIAITRTEDGPQAVRIMAQAEDLGITLAEVPARVYLKSNGETVCFQDREWDRSDPEDRYRVCGAVYHKTIKGIAYTFEVFS